ncbi:hypothetical protein ACCO45_011400 [Purpureocillium lilacinum]|uniref:Uncharacterized protein n=1 Tax=Purpureocillium lilacinum TaxID=33203 RepID=A0ACC4DCY1_PURLI
MQFLVQYQPPAGGRTQPRPAALPDSKAQACIMMQPLPSSKARPAGREASFHDTGGRWNPALPSAGRGWCPTPASAVSPHQRHSRGSRPKQDSREAAAFHGRGLAVMSPKGSPEASTAPRMPCVLLYPSAKSFSVASLGVPPRPRRPADAVLHRDVSHPPQPCRAMTTMAIPLDAAGA